MEIVKKRILPLLLALLVGLVSALSVLVVARAEGGPEELDFTAAATWENVFAWNIVEYTGGAMVVTEHPNGANAFATARRDIGSYHTAFQFSVQSDNMPRLVLKNTDISQLEGGAFLETHKSGYYLSQEGNGYNLYKGTAGGSPVYMGGIAVDMKAAAHTLDITVQDLSADAVKIVVKVDGQEVLNVTDSGDVGGVPAYTGSGYAGFGGYKAGYTLAPVTAPEVPDTPEELDLRSQSAWESLFAWNLVEYPLGAMVVTAHETGAGAFATVRRDVVSYHTAFDFTLQTGKALPRIVLKNTDLTKLEGAAFLEDNSTGYFLKPEGNGYDLYKGAAAPTFLARLGVDFTTGTHRLDITVCNQSSTAVRIVIQVDGEEKAAVTDSGDVAGTAAYTGAGFLAVGGIQSGYTIGSPVQVEELDFSSQTVWEDSLGWSKVSYRRGRMTVEGFDAYNIFNTQRKDLTGYHTRFSFTLDEGSNPPRLVLKETDMDKLASGAFFDNPSGYYLTLYDGYFDLYKAGAYLARASLDLTAGTHELDITVYNASADAVRILVKAGGETAIDYTDAADALTGAGYAGIGGYKCGFVIRTDEDGEDEDRLKILVVGGGAAQLPAGSMTGWTGNWGAAASAQDKDYVHRLLAKMQAREGYENAEILVQSSLEWEEGYALYSLSNMKAGREFDPDIIILQVGDTVDPTYAAKYSFAAYYGQLAAYFNPSGDAAVICCTSFVLNPEIDKAITAVSRKYGYPLARLDAIAADESNKPTYGAGEGQVENYDLLNYPNDKGMQAIADKLYAHIDSLLTGGDGLRSAWLYDAKNGVDVELQNGVFGAGAALKVVPVSSGSRYDAARTALGDVRIARMLDIAVTNGPASAQYRLAVSRPSFTFYEDLELYWMAEDGTLSAVEADVEGDPLVFYASRLGTLVIAYPVDPESLYGDNQIDEFEIEKVIAASPEDCVLFSYEGLEYLELTPLTFGKLLDQKKPLRFVFADGTMEISSQVFGAIASAHRLTGFGIGRATSLAVTHIEDLAVQRRIELLGGVHFEVAVLRDEQNISLSLPVKVTLRQPGLTDLTGAKMLCVEEDDYITAVDFSYSADAIAFDARNFHLYTMARVREGDDFNDPPHGDDEPNPGTGAAAGALPLAGLTGVAAGVLLPLSRKRRRLSARP